MKMIKLAFRHLRGKLGLTFGVLTLIIMASFFDGVSFGMLVPLVQSMTADTAGLIEKLPLINKMDSISRTQLVSLIFAAFLVLIALKNVFIYASSVIIARIRFMATRDLRVNLMDKLLGYDTKYFDSVKSGHIISNINVETRRMGNFIAAVLQFIAIFWRILAYTVLLFAISWKVSLVILLLIMGVLLPIEFILKRVKKLSMSISEAFSVYNNKLTEILNGIRLIKSRSTEDQEKESFSSAAHDVYKFQFINNNYMNLIIPLSEVLVLGLVVVLFLVLINLFNIDVAKSFPFIITYILVLARMLTQLNTLNGRRSAALHDIAAFSNYDLMSDATGKKTIESGNIEMAKFTNSILFNKVSFAYSEDNSVLKDITMEIPQGRITAFVGESGVGKTTIVNLILRSYDVSSGEILVDGTNLKDLNLKSWRKRIGFVSQDVFIFNTSVADNISYGHPNVSEEEIINAAKAANIHDFIDSLSDKYNTVLGERGVKLSGGQKQRISIARAIIHDPEILILDEATSSLDTKTEQQINETIDKLTKKRTVIAIAHRLSTILHADKIFVLENGKIIEEGNHANLIEKSGSYKKLYETQFNLVK